MIKYPIGYGTQEVTLEELEKIFGPPMEPEYRRRLFHWLRYKGGVVGIGSALRSWSASTSPATRAGRSFHQPQRFFDGFEGCTAVDLVVRRPGLGHSSGAVPWSEVPVQGSEDAHKWGLHANVPGESWHLQPIELDGWWQWDQAGRPRPVTNYALPFIDTVSDPMFFDPRNGIWGLWPIKQDKPRLAEPAFVEARRVRADTRWTSTGDAVLYLQSVIRFKGGGGITIDGAFGPQTKGRVQDLQAVFGQTIDGLVGPNTWLVVDFLTTT